MLAKDLRAKVRKECKRLHVNESDFATRLYSPGKHRNFCANFAYPVFQGVSYNLLEVLCLVPLQDGPWCNSKVPETKGKCVVN